MKTSLNCVWCQLRSFVSGLEKLNLDANTREAELKRALFEFHNCDWSKAPPINFVPLWERIIELNGGADLLCEAKRVDNETVMKLLPSIKEDIDKADDKFFRAMQYAIAGNINDPLPQHGLDANAVLIGAPDMKLTVDDSQLLRQRIKDAKSILYLTDNAGEIAVDKLFLDVIFELGLTTPDKVTVATRGLPSNNDALREDARQVGIADTVKVIDTGDSSMGVILERSGREFLDSFYAADLIIAKGMGNYEGLDYYMDAPICYLMMVKCKSVGECIKLPVGSFVCLFNDVHFA